MMKDKNKIAVKAGGEIMKNYNQNELKLIKNFKTKINNDTINNKNKAANEFKELKRKVNNQILKQDLIKYLEKYLFGKNLKNTELKDDRKELLLHQIILQKLIKRSKKI